MPRPTPTRRTVLVGGLGAVLGMAGCGSDPSVRPTPGPGSSGRPIPGGTPLASPSPSTPVAGAATAARLESSLAAGAAGLLARSGKTGPDVRQRRILGQIRDAHLAHVAALVSTDPTLPGEPSSGPSGSAPPSTGPTRSGGGLDTAIATLARLELAAARAHRAKITGPAGDVTLLWASLTGAAQSYAASLDSPRARSATPGGRTRQPLAAITRGTALEQLLAQVFACLYGYQAAVPFLPRAAQAAALARITDYYRLRDRLTASILAAKGDPPAADPAYQLSPRPTSPGTAGHLLAGIESRIQPFLGQWVRTSVGSERSDALDRLLDSVGRAIALGGPLDRWPGWPS